MSSRRREESDIIQIDDLIYQRALVETPSDSIWLSENGELVMFDVSYYMQSLICRRED